MNKSDFGKGIKKLQLAYNTTFTSEKLAYWWKNLQGMEGQRFLNKIDNLIQEKKFMPNIAEILDKENTASQYANYEQRDYKDSDFDKFYIR